MYRINKFFFKKFDLFLLSNYNSFMNVFIITGASKGLGYAIAKGLIDKENYIICISRHRNEMLENLAIQKGGQLKYIEFDLLNVEKIENLVKDIFSGLDIKNVKKIFLINNAAILSPLKPLSELTIKEILNNIYVNFVSTLQLTSSLLKYTQQIKAEKIIVNISSKSAENPIKNWLCYSSSKAAIDNLTKYISTEYVKKSNVKSISFHPPAMETSMFKENLESKNIFERIIDFFLIKIFKKKKVFSPEEVAEKIIHIITEKDFHSGVIIEIN